MTDKRELEQRLVEAAQNRRTAVGAYYAADPNNDSSQYGEMERAGRDIVLAALALADAIKQETTDE